MTKYGQQDDTSRQSLQESVWDYPRPPRLEPVSGLIEVWFAGERIARTRNAVRILETSHPPTFYLPAEDVRTDLLVETSRTSYCEWKGRARYGDLVVGDRCSRQAAWFYPDPDPRYPELKDRVSFYPSRVDRCTVDGAAVQAQEGDFYGGWITPGLKGPFKGGKGTLHW